MRSTDLDKISLKCRYMEVPDRKEIYYISLSISKNSPTFQNIVIFYPEYLISKLIKIRSLTVLAKKTTKVRKEAFNYIHDSWSTLLHT